MINLAKLQQRFPSVEVGGLESSHKWNDKLLNAHGQNSGMVFGKQPKNPSVQISLASSDPIPHRGKGSGTWP